MSVDPAAPAVAAAEIAASAGIAAAQIGYRLTTQTLNASVDDAATVFPLLLVEVTAIAGGVTAYHAVDEAWCTAQRAAEAAAVRGTARWPTVVG